MIKKKETQAKTTLPYSNSQQKTAGHDCVAPKPYLRGSVSIAKIDKALKELAGIRSGASEHPTGRIRNPDKKSAR